MVDCRFLRHENEDYLCLDRHWMDSFSRIATDKEHRSYGYPLAAYQPTDCPHQLPTSLCGWGTEAPIHDQNMPTRTRLCLHPGLFMPFLPATKENSRDNPAELLAHKNCGITWGPSGPLDLGHNPCQLFCVCNFLAHAALWTGVGHKKKKGFLFGCAMC